jgi:chemotaxis protein MotB
MIFFLVMFSFAVGKQGAKGGTKKQKEQAENIEESLAQIQKVFGGKVDPKIQQRKEQRKQEEDVAQNLQQAVDEKQLGKYVTVNATEEKVKLVLKEAIVFDSGKAELKPAAAPILAEIAAELAKLHSQILVEGHTDNVPIHHGRYSSNWELSMARAYAVIKFFEEHGVEPKYLSGIGYGEFRPISPNTTPEGRAQNRRIGIELLRGGQGEQQPDEAPAAPAPAGPAASLGSRTPSARPGPCASSCGP